jgi:hypothetical protein
LHVSDTFRSELMKQIIDEKVLLYSVHLRFIPSFSYCHLIASLFVSVRYMFIFSAKIKSQFGITNETNIAKNTRNVIQRVVHSFLTLYTVLQISVYKIISRV